MSRFTTYSIKEISSSFLFLTLLFTGILWMGQGLRHINLLTTENVSLTSYLSYVILLFPKIILLVIPISTFLSVLLNMVRLRNDSELIILWASGKSDIDIFLKPILFISLLMYFLLSFISLYLTPISLNEIRHKIIEIRSSGIHSSILKEKKFISPIDTLTIFLQERDGNKISGLLIHDFKNADKPQTYIAETGEFISNLNNKFLRLYNGNIQIFEKDSNKISEIEFESYDLDLMPYNQSEDTHIYSDEILTSKLINNLSGKKTSEFNSYEKEQYAELNSRIINPLYLFCYALLPLIIIKISRKPDDSWFLPIAAIAMIAIFIQIIQITFSNLLVEYNNLIALNYSLPFIFISIILIILFFEQIKKFKLRNA